MRTVAYGSDLCPQKEMVVVVVGAAVVVLQQFCLQVGLAAVVVLQQWV